MRWLPAQICTSLAMTNSYITHNLVDQSVPTILMNVVRTLATGNSNGSRYLERFVNILPVLIGRHDESCWPRSVWNFVRSYRGQRLVWDLQDQCYRRRSIASNVVMHKGCACAYKSLPFRTRVMAVRDATWFATRRSMRLRHVHLLW